MKYTQKSPIPGKAWGDWAKSAFKNAHKSVVVTLHVHEVSVSRLVAGKGDGTWVSQVSVE